MVSGGSPPLYQPQGAVYNSSGLRHFAPSLKGRTVGVFADNTTALVHLRRQGGTLLPALNREAQLLLRWAQFLQIHLVPQFIMGSRNVVADSPSHQDVSSGGGVGSSASLAGDDRPLLHSAQLSPASLLFAIQRPHGGGDQRLPPVVGSSPDLCLSPVFSNSPSPVQAPVQPGHSSDADTPLWPQKEWYLDLLRLPVAPPVALPSRPDLLRQPDVYRLHQNLCMLQLHAWRLSSTLQDI